MALLNLKTAARMAGVSRQTLYRKMSEGAISWDVDPQGRRRIESSELMRVFGPMNSHGENLRDVTCDTVRKGENDLDGYLLAIETLKEQVKSERERASRAEAEAEFLRQALAKAQDQATRLITHQSSTPKRQTSPWWRFWSSRD
jgi:hypothetical protein